MERAPQHLTPSVGGIPPSLPLRLTACWLVLIASACLTTKDIRLGMTQQEVVQRLGEPDRKAVLVGKELRDLNELENQDVARLRLVYVYEQSGIQVWFKDDSVTGVTQDGVSIRQERRRTGEDNLTQTYRKSRGMR